MKRELKIGDSQIITITDNGMVSVPSNIRMRDFELSELFGVYTQMIRANVKAILKSGMVNSNIGCPLIVVGGTLIPEYYNLEMVIALAFRIKSRNSKILREWFIDSSVKGSMLIDYPIFEPKQDFRLN